MKPWTAVILPISLLACAAQQPPAPSPNHTAEVASNAMEVSRSNVRPPFRGPADWFTGAVTVTPLFDPKGPSQVGAALVRFEPGARTAWHKHPLGQRLVVLEGSGWTQVEGKPIEAIRVGDDVWCPPPCAALARRDTNNRDGAHCDTGIAERFSGHLDGTRA